MWRDLKDPSLSDEEHRQALQVRVQRLHGLSHGDGSDDSLR